MNRRRVLGLTWLLDRDPATLGADQRETREKVAEVVKKGG